MTGRKRMKWLLAVILCIVLFGAFSFSAADSSLTVTSTEKTLKVVNGQTATLHIGITNDGSAEMKDITVQIDLPYKWIIQSMDPGTISLLPGESGEFIIVLAVPASENASTHTLNVSCKSGDLTSDIINIPVAVVTNPVFGYVIIGCVVLMIAGTVFYFRRNVRR
jgi:uncharacterized membrane protein